jgi:hypothetical protein
MKDKKNKIGAVIFVAVLLGLVTLDTYVNVYDKKAQKYHDKKTETISRQKTGVPRQDSLTAKQYDTICRGTRVKFYKKQNDLSR